MRLGISAAPFPTGFPLSSVLRRCGEVGIRVLAEHGLDREARTQVLALLNNYVTGFAHRQVASDQLRQRAGLTDEERESKLQRYRRVRLEGSPIGRGCGGLALE